MLKQKSTFIPGPNPLFDRRSRATVEIDGQRVSVHSVEAREAVAASLVHDEVAHDEQTAPVKTSRRARVAPAKRKRTRALPPPAPKRKRGVRRADTKAKHRGVREATPAPATPAKKKRGARRA